MSTQGEHKEQAEFYLAEATRSFARIAEGADVNHAPAAELFGAVDRTLAMAQVHATLATIPD